MRAILMESDEMIRNVFVYGTLKRGYGNNRLLANAEFVGEATTVGIRYKMLHAGFPVAMRSTEGKQRRPIVGEVFRIKEYDDVTLQLLDRLESNGRMYNRRVVDVRLADGKRTRAWIYLGDHKFWGYRREEFGVVDQDGRWIWPNSTSESVGMDLSACESRGRELKGVSRVLWHSKRIGVHQCRRLIRNCGKCLLPFGPRKTWPKCLA
jgi:gamma-glutamylaminecyclotransferase